jgi:hypothetical protein
MTDPKSDLDTLWRSVPRAPRAFDPQDVAHLPELARSYLAHAIAPGTPLARAVRLRMHGLIRLKRWRKFKAVQVITSDGAMIWCASVSMGSASIRGYDRFVSGEGEMKWRLFGLIPIIREAGPDVTRSIANRVAAESIWLPSMLADERVRWRADDANVARAGVPIGRHATELRMTLDHGRLIAVDLPRWGNPGGGPFREAPFGAYVDQEATFDGYTIPVRLRIGWHFDDAARFDAEGKFFEVSIDNATYR